MKTRPKQELTEITESEKVFSVSSVTSCSKLFCPPYFCASKNANKSRYSAGV